VAVTPSSAVIAHKQTTLDRVACVALNAAQLFLGRRSGSSQPSSSSLPGGVAGTASSVPAAFTATHAGGDSATAGLERATGRWLRSVTSQLRSHYGCDAPAVEGLTAPRQRAVVGVRPVASQVARGSGGGDTAAISEATQTAGEPTGETGGTDAREIPPPPPPIGVSNPSTPSLRRALPAVSGAVGGNGLMSALPRSLRSLLAASGGVADSGSGGGSSVNGASTPGSSTGATPQVLAAAGRVARALLWGLNTEGEPVATEAVRYPFNLNLRDFVTFSFMPTVVYEPSFPRTQRVRLGYLVEKLALAAGLVLVGAHIITAQMAPVFKRIDTMHPVDAIAALMLPCSLFILIIFFTMFEVILNACAEVTRFGDREW
jgi:hypothetical protein